MIKREFLSEFNGKIAAILDDGPPAYSSESTVISLCSKPAKILRQGVFPKEAIEDVLKMDLWWLINLAKRKAINQLFLFVL